jgi:PKD repeat protein
MKKICYFFCVIALIILSCKKKEPLPAPTAGFELGLTIATQGVIFTPLNTSQNATSYLWDFGNGLTSKEKVPTFQLTTIGEHKISLTVTNVDGTTSTSSKIVKIVAPMITSIIITNLQNWAGEEFSSLKKFSGGDVWVEIRESKRIASYVVLEDGSYNYPLFFKSPVVNVQASVTQPVVIKIDSKVILDRDPTSDKRYSFNLYVKDATGVHMLFTSDFLGSFYLPILSTNTYSWSSSFGVEVELKGSYY